MGKNRGQKRFNNEGGVPTRKMKRKAEDVLNGAFSSKKGPASKENVPVAPSKTNDTAAPSVPKTLEDRKAGQRVFVVLEHAPLEIVSVKGRYELMNADDHKSMILKAGRKLENMRPDITHQCLMSLLDSPLNKAGKLWIYIHTANNTLIEINPSLRIPRTYKRFAGLMVELLHRNKIKAVNSSTTLMKVIANPVTKYLPEGGRKIGFSVNGKSVNIRKYVEQLDETGGLDQPVTFVVGAVAHGDPLEDPEAAQLVEEQISISHWGLSASCCCGKICNEFEQLWGVM